MQSNVPLTNRVALITGGSSGIGAETAKLFAQEGWQVIVGYYRGEQRANAVLGAMPGQGHSIVRLALEDSGSIAAAASMISAQFGKLDVLVNSAGFTRPVPHADLEALDDELFDSVLTTNVRGVFSSIRAMTPLLRKSGDSVIINVSSISAFTAFGSSIAYAASKAALDTMTMSLARALGPDIRVLCVSPGAVATDFVAGRDRSALEKAAQKIPLKRVIEPQDVARAILACVTHLRVATGAKILVDGGQHLF